MTKKPFILIILDGWGHREDTNNNAIALAKTPVWDQLWKNAPHLLLSGSGLEVGLPDGQMGNSEVGHMTIGLGRIIDQDLTRISKAITDQSFFKNPLLLSACHNVAQKHTAIHLMGLFSPGGIHSHEDHFFAALELFKQNNINVPVYVHAFLDGRDTPPKSAKASLMKLQDWFDHNPIGQIASICGRFYAMDRDQRYARTQLAYDMLTQGVAPFKAASALEALEAAYARGETDEFIKPTLILDDHSHPIFIQKEQTVFFLNFRSDRTRQLSYAFTNPAFTGFERHQTPLLNSNSHFITMTQYAQDLSSQVVFAPKTLSMGLGEVLQNLKYTQLRIAETEKYAHVTFFFNGGMDTPFTGEERIMIPSPTVRTYDEKPQMSANELTDAIIKAMHTKQYDVIICNYANADMVGHTGNLNSAIEAITTIDACLGRLVETIHALNAQALITADHGNAECMQDTLTHEPHTAHTTNLVPLVYVGKQDVHFKKMENTATLADIAPTLLDLMQIQPPPEMTGQSLLEK